jgi:hypothetical protein
LALCSIALLTTKHADGVTLVERNFGVLRRVYPAADGLSRGILHLRGGEGEGEAPSPSQNTVDPFRLWEAARDGNIDEIRSAVEAGVDPLAKDGDDMTALHHASAWGRTDCCEFLINLGADVGSKACDGSTALHLSAWYGHLDTCRMLISKGASVVERDRDGSHPLHNAAFKGQDEICLLLLQTGGRVDAAQVSLWMNATDHLKSFIRPKYKQEGSSNA